MCFTTILLKIKFGFVDIEISRENCWIMTRKKKPLCVISTLFISIFICYKLVT